MPKYLWSKNFGKWMMQEGEKMSASVSVKQFWSVTQHWFFSLNLWFKLEIKQLYLTYIFTLIVYQSSVIHLSISECFSQRIFFLLAKSWFTGRFSFNGSAVAIWKCHNCWITFVSRAKVKDTTYQLWQKLVELSILFHLLYYSDRLL